MLWPLSVVLVANTNGRLAISALAGLLVNDEMVGGRERVTTDEERVLRGD